MKRRTALKYAATLFAAGLAVRNTGSSQKKYVSTSQKQNTMRIQRLGWAGLKIETASTTLFVDAIYGDPQKDIALTAGTAAVHALITHHHYDHYDVSALQKVFHPQSRLYCYDKCLPWLDGGLTTQPVKLYEPVDVSGWAGELTAIPVPAVDGFGHPQVSWVIKGGGKTIIHCGDTLWHGYWHTIAQAYGPFDIAFVPINGARINMGKVTDTGMPAVMTPEQAVVAGKLLQAKYVCPIHYGRPAGTYFETPDPENSFLQFANERKVTPLLVKEGDEVRWPS